MTAYTVTDPTTNKSITMEGDHPPTPDDIEEVFTQIHGPSVTSTDTTKPGSLEREIQDRRGSGTKERLIGGAKALYQQGKNAVAGALDLPNIIARGAESIAVKPFSPSLDSTIQANRRSTSDAIKKLAGASEEGPGEFVGQTAATLPLSWLKLGKYAPEALRGVSKFLPGPVREFLGNRGIQNVAGNAGLGAAYSAGEGGDPVTGAEVGGGMALAPPILGAGLRKTPELHERLYGGKPAETIRYLADGSHTGDILAANERLFGRTVGNLDRVEGRPAGGNESGTNLKNQIDEWRNASERVDPADYEKKFPETIQRNRAIKAADTDPLHPGANVRKIRKAVEDEMEELQTKTGKGMDDNEKAAYHELEQIRDKLVGNDRGGFNGYIAKQNEALVNEKALLQRDLEKISAGLEDVRDPDGVEVTDPTRLGVSKTNALEPNLGETGELYHPPAKIRGRAIQTELQTLEDALAGIKKRASGSSPAPQDLGRAAEIMEKQKALRNEAAELVRSQPPREKVIPGEGVGIAATGGQPLIPTLSRHLEGEESRAAAQAARARMVPIQERVSEIDRQLAENSAKLFRDNGANAGVHMPVEQLDAIRKHIIDRELEFKKKANTRLQVALGRIRAETENTIGEAVTPYLKDKNGAPVAYRDLMKRDANKRKLLDEMEAYFSPGNTDAAKAGVAGGKAADIFGFKPNDREAEKLLSRWDAMNGESDGFKKRIAERHALELGPGNDGTAPWLPDATLSARQLGHLGAGASYAAFAHGHPVLGALLAAAEGASSPKLAVAATKAGNFIGKHPNIVVPPSLVPVAEEQNRRRLVRKTQADADSAYARSARATREANP